MLALARCRLVAGTAAGCVPFRRPVLQGSTCARGILGRCELVTPLVPAVAPMLRFLPTDRRPVQVQVFESPVTSFPGSQSSVCAAHSIHAFLFAFP